MADIVPKHNQNTVELANILDDALQGGDNGIKAAAGGATFSAAKLNEYLAHAYSWIVGKFIQAFGVDTASRLLQGLVKSQTLTFSGTRIALNKDYLRDIMVIKAGSSTIEYVKKSLDDIYREKDPFANNVYVIEGGYLSVYDRSTTYALAPSGTGILYYFKAERVDSSTGTLGSPNNLTNSEDITLDTMYHPACVRYAAILACTDKGDDAHRQKAALHLEQLKTLVPPEVKAIL